MMIQKYGFSLIGILLVMVAFWGCDERSIQALEEEESGGVYSIYGALDMEQDTHYVRIKELQKPFLTEEKIDALVTFENLETGDVATLSDTVVNFSDQLTQNYIVVEDLEPRKSYRIVAERSDGASSSSLVTMPGVTEHSVSPTQNIFCDTELTFTFENVLPDELVRMEVGITHNNQSVWYDVTRDCGLSYTGNNTYSFKTTTRKLLGLLFPAPGVNQPSCSGTPSATSCTSLDSKNIRVRYVHFSPEWDAVYPVRPSNPLDILDVENGLGFLGGIRRDSYSYVVQ